MKTTLISPAARPLVAPRGFALVVTLSLMILLALLAVGLLSLSSVSLRAAGQGQARALAQANARVAMLLALGTPFKDGATNNAAKTAQLGAGERPGVEFIPGLGKLERKFYQADGTAFATLEKGVTRENFALAGNLSVDGDKNQGRWASCLGAARDDKFHVLFAPLGTPLAKNKFIIRMAASTGPSSNRTTVSAIEMDYESLTGLQDAVIGKGGTLRWPKSGAVNALDMLDHSTVKIRDILNPGKSHGFGRPTQRDDFNMATVAFQFQHEDAWRTASESMVRFIPGVRYVVLAYLDPASGRPRISTYQDFRRAAAPPAAP